MTLTVGEVMAMLPPDPFFLATILTTEGETPWHDTLVVRPRDAAGDGFPVDRAWATLACLSLVPAETLEPMYGGYPGTVWPVSAVTRSGKSIVLVGPRGTATLTVLPRLQLAEFSGRADRLVNTGVSPAEPTAGLPVNRKERYYTGTVLAQIVAGQGLRELGRLLELCGLPPVADRGDPAMDEVQFFTEYSFAESVFTEPDRKRFARRPLNADTPDVVIVGRDWLLAIEAKMFHRPNAATVVEQYRQQAVLVAYWRKRFGIEPERARHVLLLPAQLADELKGTVSAPIVTWQEVQFAYRNVSDPYWHRALASALDNYAELASKDATWGQHAQLRLTGEQIVAAYGRSDGSVIWMGRSGGLRGPKLESDISAGAWSSRAYEVRDSPPPGTAKNWFPVAEFVARLPAVEP